MCGIAGFHLKPGANIAHLALERFADTLLSEIDHRGGDACGFAARSDDGRLVVQRASCTARTFSAERKELPHGVRTVLLHTRFATQGDASFPENNHPVSAGDVLCVHNGHVTNDWELIKQSGLERRGRVDSEAIPATVHMRGWENAGRALEDVEGAAAVAMLHAPTGSLILARASTSPLVVVESSSIVAWASTWDALRYSWSEALGTPPHGSRFATLAEGTLLRFEPHGAKTTERFTVSEPVYVRRYFGSSWMNEDEDNRPRMGAADEAKLARVVPSRRVTVWDDETRDEAAELGLMECTCCGDFYYEDELERVYSNWDTCATCSRFFGGAFEREALA